MIVRVWNLVTDSPPIDDTVPIILGGEHIDGHSRNTPILTHLRSVSGHMQPATKDPHRLCSRKVK